MLSWSPRNPRSSCAPGSNCALTLDFERSRSLTHLMVVLAWQSATALIQLRAVAEVARIAFLAERRSFVPRVSSPLQDSRGPDIRMFWAALVRSSSLALLQKLASEGKKSNSLAVFVWPAVAKVCLKLQARSGETTVWDTKVTLRRGMLASIEQWAGVCTRGISGVSCFVFLGLFQCRTSDCASRGFAGHGRPMMLYLLSCVLSAAPIITTPAGSARGFTHWPWPLTHVNTATGTSLKTLACQALHTTHLEHTLRVWCGIPKQLMAQNHYTLCGIPNSGIPGILC